jgi:hypothetical protein
MEFPCRSLRKFGRSDVFCVVVNVHLELNFRLLHEIGLFVNSTEGFKVKEEPMGDLSFDGGYPTIEEASNNSPALVSVSNLITSHSIPFPATTPDLVG